MLLWAWVMMVYASAIGQLQRHVSWSMADAEARHTRQQRVDETRRGIEREIEASIRPTGPDLPDVPMDPPEDRRGPDDRADRGGAVP